MSKPVFDQTTSSFLKTLIDLETIIRNIKDDAGNNIFKSFYDNTIQANDNNHISTFGTFLVVTAVENIALQEQSSSLELECYAIFVSSKISFRQAMAGVVSKLREEWAKPTIVKTPDLVTRFVPTTIERSVGLPAGIFPNIEGRDPFWSIRFILNKKLKGY